MPAQSELDVGVGGDNENVWVFGYGSLIWKPNFKYEKVLSGHIEGVSRKFWQGSRDHRGTAEKPGRVATLVDDKNGSVCGLGFELCAEEAEVTFNYLNDRETGYNLREVVFYPSDPSQPKQKVLVYTATPNNPDFLGPAPIMEMAECIATCQGHAGPNSEYLFNLAHMMRLLFPLSRDDELFELERNVKKIKNGYVKKNEKR